MISGRTRNHRHRFRSLHIRLLVFISGPGGPHHALSHPGITPTFRLYSAHQKVRSSQVISFRLSRFPSEPTHHPFPTTFITHPIHQRIIHCVQFMSSQGQVLARQLQRFHRTGHSNAAEISEEDLRFARLIAPSPDVIEYELEDQYPIQWLQRRNFNAFLIGWRSRYNIIQNRPQRIRYSAQNQASGSTSRQQTQAQPPVQQTSALIHQNSALIQQTSARQALADRARELLATPYRRPRIGHIDFGDSSWTNRPRSNSDTPTTTH